jgi:hypothetical protein
VGLPGAAGAGAGVPAGAAANSHLGRAAAALRRHPAHPDSGLAGGVFYSLWLQHYSGRSITLISARDAAAAWTADCILSCSLEAVIGWL